MVIALFVVGWLVRRSGRKRKVRRPKASPHFTSKVSRQRAPEAFRQPTPSVFRQTPPTGKGDTVVWHPPGVPARLGRHTVADGMVYVGTPARDYDSEEGCVLDPKLPVATSKEAAQALGYWPSYRGISPASRRVYLDWLGSGKQAPDIDIGYVFLYFYGLERRVFMESAPTSEIVALAVEVERLRAIYTGNGSFDGYSRRFLEAVATLRGLSAGVEAVFSPDLLAPAGEMPMMLKVAIAREVVAQRPLSFELAAAGVIGLYDFAARHRFVLRSGREQFLTILRERFLSTFPTGFLVRNRKDSQLQLPYRGATSGLYVDLVKRVGLEKLPDPATLTWTKLVSLAEAVAVELYPFIRTLSQNPAKAEALAAFVACPPELAASTAVDARRWLNGLGSPAAVRFGDLVKYVTGLSGAKWTIRQHRQVADVLKLVGKGMEPDPADGSANLEDDTVVHVFECAGGGAEGTGNLRTAAAAALLVAGVAKASGGQGDVVENSWLGQLPEQLPLSANEKTRLRARLIWLRGSAGGLAKAKRLLTNAKAKDREICAWSASTAVAATGAPTKQQVAMLEKIYDGLGVPRSSLYATLHSGIASATPAADEPVAVSDETQAVLHPIRRPPAANASVAAEDRLATIRAETERVSALLAEIFVAEEASVEAEPEEAVMVEDPLSGLDAAHRAFAAKLLSGAEWPREEFEALAKEGGLMPNGAMETINEWAFDRHGDALIEDGPMVVINLDLLPAGAEAAE